MNQIAIISIAVGSILLTFAFTYALLAMAEAKKIKGRKATKTQAEWMSAPVMPKKPKRGTLEGFSAVHDTETTEKSDWISQESWEAKQKPVISEAKEERLISSGARAKAKQERIHVSVAEASFDE